MAMGAVLSSSRAFASPLSSSSSSSYSSPGKKHDIRYPAASPPHNRWACSLVPGDRNGRQGTRSNGTAEQLSVTMTRFCCGASLRRRRVLSRVECFLSSSDPVISGWHKPRRRESLAGSDTACVAQPEYRVPVRKRADCKAEQYEMTGSPSDVPAEAGVLVGEDAGGVSPWWQQFPRRWTIVVLCFFSFLLCNMDRVNMSIAILPMSAEYGWSPATVGLIQSSFFWGYLLTQIPGGIWADRFGGKVVLGFGVVWWCTSAQ